MLPLPFSLKVPSKDNRSEDTVVSWTTFAFHGLMHCDGTALYIEWSGTAATDEVTGASVRSATVSLPTESVTAPLTRLRTVKLAGGWWRPRLEISGNDMSALPIVPSEAGGKVRCWISLGDRRLARELAATMHRAAQEQMQGAASRLIPE